MPNVGFVIIIIWEDPGFFFIILVGSDLLFHGSNNTTPVREILGFEESVLFVF